MCSSGLAHCIWHSQYPRALVPQCTSAAVECCGLKGGRNNKGCPCAAVESKIAKLSLEIAKLRHRVACREQSCRRRTRCVCSLPRLHCARTVQALPPCITGHLFCPVLRGWATDPRTGSGGAWGRGWGTDPRTSKSGVLESQRLQKVSRTKRPNHRNPTNRFNSGTHFFCTFCHLSRGEKWVSLHKQSLPEEDDCTQASDSHLTVCWVGVQQTLWL